MRGATPNGRRSSPRWLVLVACLGPVFGALAAGCGLDDTAVAVLGEDTSGNDASLVDTGTPVGDSGPADTGPVCTPKTCAAYASDCRSSLPDDCGGTIDCSGTCPSGQACVGDAGAGTPGGAYCNGPPVCLDAGAVGGNCGTLTNAGTGQTTTCSPSTCTNTGYTCNSNVCTCAAGGTVCGAVCCSGATPNCNATNTACCKKKTCAVDYPGQCANNADDGCGGMLDCSNNCLASTFCGPTNKKCGPKPTCTNMGKPGGACGTITDGTSGLIQDCGGCGNGYACVSNVCTCVPQCDGYTCNGNDGCGGTCGCTKNPGYDSCYAATNHCDCDNGGACGACAPGFKQCSLSQYRWCIPSSASCN